MEEKTERKLNELAEIASLYYEQDLTQSQIAKRMLMSRSKVSRLLKQSREQGIVDIKINFAGERYYESEKQLIATYGLKDARVYNNRSEEDTATLSGIGRLGAEYLLNNMVDGSILGITWGRAVYETVQALRQKKKSFVDVVQIMGSAATTNEHFNSTESVRMAAKHLGGKPYYLNAPLYMQDDYARERLLSDPFISKTLELGQNADVILTGIGSMTYQNYMRLFRGYCTDVDYDQIKKQDAVGYICAHFYNQEGEFLTNDINSNIVGIDVNYLRKIETVIGVAGGVEKVEAIKGAIKGQLINVLITDLKTANAMLAGAIKG